MATKTREDLVLGTLEKLGVLATGQNPDVEETARVDGRLPGLIEEFAAREIVYVPDLEHVPLPWFESLTSMIAYECRDSFGVTGDDGQMLKDKNDEAITKLRIMLRGRPTYQTLRSDFV